MVSGGSKNFRSQRTKKMREDRWWSETRVFDIIKAAIIRLE